MHQDIIDGDTTSGGAVEELVVDLGILGEAVESEGLVAGVDEVDGVVVILDGEDGEEGSEDFIGHQWVVELDIVEDRGGDVAFLFDGLTTTDDLATVQETLEALEVTVVDDAGVVRGVLGFFAVETDDGFLHLVDELGLDRFVGEDVVDGDAGLSTVDELTPHDTAGSNGNIGTAVNIGRGLATEFKSH